MLRFLPPDDSRMRATVRAIAAELSRDGLVQRYLPGETDDGLAGQEATFSICSFWLVSALAEISEQAYARELCEKLLSYAGLAAALRGRDRPRDPAGTGETSLRRSPTLRSSTR